MFNQFQIGSIMMNIKYSFALFLSQIEQVNYMGALRNCLIKHLVSYDHFLLFKLATLIYIVKLINMFLYKVNKIETNSNGTPSLFIFSYLFIFYLILSIQYYIQHIHCCPKGLVQISYNPHIAWRLLDLRKVSFSI